MKLQLYYVNLPADTNECMEEPLQCGPYAECFNTDGSFYCVCYTGYSGSGTSCTAGMLWMHNRLVLEQFVI